MRNRVQTTASPSQPLAPPAYNAGHFNQYANALRLYFNQVDSIFRALLGSNGGKYVEFPHIAASDSSDQYAGGDNTPTLVRWDMLDAGSGFTLNPNGTAQPDQSGIYKIDYSLQLANSDNAAHNVFVWLEVNGGTPVPNSSTKFTIPARKSASEPSYVTAYSHITFEITAGDTISLYWATDRAYNTTGPVEGVFIDALPAQTTPYVRPANPSALGSIIFVSNSIA
jgi:hypothetical protein